MPPRALTPAGLVLYDKPAGPSSFAIVRDVRDRTGARAGHAGTLDPFATGLLLVLLGAFTKEAQRFVGVTKRYETAVDLSAITSTGDPEGEVVDEHDPLSEDELEARIAELRGEVDLRIPTASAVKIGGERAYKLHRRGVAVEMPMRRTTVHALDLLEYNGNVARLGVHISSGGYVRALAEALGGHCVSLRRTHVGPFDVGRRRSRADRPARRSSRHPRAMKVAHSPRELGGGPRAVALGTLDGVHLGHRRMIEAALESGPEPTVVTFDPHPRTVLGHRVELLTTLERRLELIAELGVEAALVVEFTPELARLEPEEFAEGVLRAIGAEVVVAGADFRFGRDRKGDVELLRSLGFDARSVPLLDDISSSRIRELVRAGDVQGAAERLGRPVEVEGVVVAGDARGGTLGFPTANLDVRPELLVPSNGIYAGAAGGHRAAVSIGTNPHYGGRERRVEAFLLDFSGDLYGQRLVVELWQRLRDEQAFETESDLIEQIAADVELARQAKPPA